MNEQEIMQYTFKFNCFKTFPVSEFEKIVAKMREIGYEGELVDNGNVVFSKVGGNNVK